MQRCFGQKVRIQLHSKRTRLRSRSERTLDSFEAAAFQKRKRNAVRSTPYRHCMTFFFLECRDSESCTRRKCLLRSILLNAHMMLQQRYHTRSRIHTPWNTSVEEEHRSTASKSDQPVTNKKGCRKRLLVTERSSTASCHALHHVARTPHCSTLQPGIESLFPSTTEQYLRSAAPAIAPAIVGPSLRTNFKQRAIDSRFPCFRFKAQEAGQRREEATRQRVQRILTYLTASNHTVQYPRQCCSTRPPFLR